jgi:hypothetical protein
LDEINLDKNEEQDLKKKDSLISSNVKFDLKPKFTTVIYGKTKKNKDTEKIKERDEIAYNSNDDKNNPQNKDINSIERFNLKIMNANEIHIGSSNNEYCEYLRYKNEFHNYLNKKRKRNIPNEDIIKIDDRHIERIQEDGNSYIIKIEEERKRFIKEKEKHFTLLKEEEKRHLSEVIEEKERHLSKISEEEERHLSKVKEEEERHLSKVKEEEERHLSKIREEEERHLSKIREEEERHLSKVKEEEERHLSKVKEEEERHLSKVREEGKRHLSKVGEEGERFKNEEEKFKRIAKEIDINIQKFLLSVKNMKDEFDS